MLRSTFYSFTTALRGMNTAQKQLDITGQNISNVSTEGYTRQRADVYAAAPAGYGDKYATRASTMVGQGSVVSAISQCRDQFLDVRFRREAASLGEQDEKLGTMNDLSEIFDEIEKSGLMNSFNDFVSKLQVLANNAESPEFDSVARDAAQTLSNQFNHYAKQVANIREEKEYNLREVTVASLNDLMTNIAALNKSIRQVQANGNPALELKDERNLLLDQLSSYMKLDVKYDPKELASGIVVDDVTISMVNENGDKQELIYNDMAAQFNVKTSLVDGTNKAIVTVDNSALPSGKFLNNLNSILESISINSATIHVSKNELMEKFPSDFPSATYGSKNAGDIVNDLGTLINNLSTDVSNLGNTINTLTNQVNEYSLTYYKKALAGTLTDTDLTNLQTALIAKANAESERIAKVDKIKELSVYHREIKQANENLNSTITGLNSVLAAESGKPENDWNLSAVVQWTQGDYSSLHVDFTGTDKNGVNRNSTWKTSNNAPMSREGLEQIGIFYDDKFDAEEFDSPGSLRGALQMLNSKGTYDYNSNNIRGIGFYENLLDTLADKFAKTMNSLNDKRSTENIREYLFETSDGSANFTASNIRISQDWLDGKYGLTGSQRYMPGDNSAQNDNILLMISTISSKMTYSTGPVALMDAQGNYLKLNADGTTSIAANARDKNGNYILTRDPNTGATIDPPRLVADKNLINYDTSGNLQANTVGTANKLVEYPKFSGSYYTGLTVDSEGNVTNPGAATSANLAANEVGDDGNLYKVDNTTTPPTRTFVATSEGIIYGGGAANGRDKMGNFTLTKLDSTGKLVTEEVANSDGVLYRRGANGKIATDSEGFPILSTTYADANARITGRTPSFVYRGSFQEYLSNMSNQLSLDISSTSNLQENHQAVLDSIETSRESISSVSLDEEGVNIMQFQKAYNAAARLMTALDEAVERIINQMGTVGR